MKTKTPFAYFLIPLTYLGVIAFFFYMQFGQRTTEIGSFKGLEFTAKYQSGESDRDSLRSFTLDCGPLSLPFNLRKGIILEDINGQRHRTRITSFEAKEETLVLEMTKGVRLTLSITGNEPSRRIILTPELLENTTEITALHIPFSQNTGFNLERESSIPVLVLSNQETNWFLATDSSSKMDWSKGEFILIPEQNRYKKITMEESLSNGTDPFLFLFTQSGDFISQREYDILNDEFWKKADQGWRTRRVNTIQHGWDNGLGRTSYSNEIAAALFSEAALSGRLPQVMSLFPEMAERRKNEVSFLSTPYMGHLMGATDEYRMEAKSRLDLYRKKISRNEPLSYAGFPLELFLTSGDKETPAKLARQLKQERPETTSTEDALELIRTINALEERRSILKTPSLSEENLLLVKQHLYPSLAKTEEGLFLISENNVSDLRQTILAGIAMQNAGKNQKEGSTQALGRELVASALKLSDRNGYLPAKIILSEGKITKSEGVLTPEELYTKLRENPFYPRTQEFPISNTPEPLQIYTASDSVKVREEQNRLVIRTRFPVGQDQHLVVSNLPAFEEIMLFGIKWNSDPRFQRYSSGWLYDKGKETLYIKIRHKKPVEEFVVQFAPKEESLQTE